MDNARTKRQEALLKALHDDPESGLSNLYGEYKKPFLAYIRRYGGRPEDHLDAYHDAVLGFYDVYRHGKYVQERASINTLLYTIGKYRLLKRLGKAGREPVWEHLEHVEEVVLEYQNVEDSDRWKRTRKAMQELGEGCREILELFYFRRFSIKEIAIQLDYKNENVVKAHKSRCMKRLKTILQSTEHETLNTRGS